MSRTIALIVSANVLAAVLIIIAVDRATTSPNPGPPLAVVEEPKSPSPPPEPSPARVAPTTTYRPAPAPRYSSPPPSPARSTARHDGHWWVTASPADRMDVCQRMAQFLRGEGHLVTASGLYAGYNDHYTYRELRNTSIAELTAVYSVTLRAAGK